jgi:hypothetical protein
LQKVETDGTVLDAFEAPAGVPFRTLIENGRPLPWSTLRHWLHDLATELWAASGDRTLPAEASLDHVWITAQGRAVLMDLPWPASGTPAETIPVSDIAGQQRFLHAVAAHVDATGLPLHARPVLQNIANGRFEKISFLTGILRGLLDRPAEANRTTRAGSMFMLPFYIWVLVFLGTWHGAEWLYAIVGRSPLRIATVSALLVLVVAAAVQLLEVPLRATVGQSVFRLTVVDGKGRPAGRLRLLARWAIAWLPLLIPLAPAALWISRAEPRGFALAFPLMALWVGVACLAVVRPDRGLHDRWAGTRVVHR